MSYYLDTNIAIGYALSWDPWNECSIEILKQKPLYTSLNMYKEYKEVLYRKLDKYYTFFDLIVIELEKEENFLDENFNDLKFKKIVMNINFKLNNDLKKDRQEKENIANFLIKYFNLYSYIDLIKLHQKVISYRDRLYLQVKKELKNFLEI